LFLIPFRTNEKSGSQTANFDEFAVTYFHKNFSRYFNSVRFRVLTAVSINIAVFWDVAPCSLGVDDVFRGAHCLLDQGGDGRSTHL
jgi:hypothetical protein